MKHEKSQYQRIADRFITITVIVISLTLVGSGIAVSKSNTDYLETGVRTPKVTIERKSRQIFISDSKPITIPIANELIKKAETVLQFMPPPIDTTYYIIRSIEESKAEKSP